MKLADYKKADAVALLGEIAEPAERIITDEKIKKSFSDKTSLLHKAAVICRLHPDDVFEILAKMDGKTVEEYECSIFTLPARVLEILTDTDFMDFFGFAVPNSMSSGSVTENTEETAET